MTNQVSMFPTTFAQQQLWLVDQMAPGSAVNNIPTAVSLRGRLSISVLERALNEIVRRHDSLRTTFTNVDGQPMQIVARELHISIPLLDMREATSPAEAIVGAWVRDDTARPFDLIAGPLIRAALLAFNDSHHVLILTMHHLISDGWSVDILNRELSTLYHAFETGSPSPLPELRIQYPDFAIWQRNWFRGETLRRQIEYWKRQLAGAPLVLELPTNKPRPPAKTFEGRRIFRHFKPSLWDGIKNISRREGATPFMTVFAALQILLQRYSHQDDILVGTPVANRTRTETEGMIGLFVNTLVMRGDLSGDPSFRELLRRTRETCLGAFAHQDVPFEKLVEEMAPERRLSHTPLFQVMFVLQNAQTSRKSPRSTSTSASASRELKVQGMPIESGAAKFDMTFSVTETKLGLLAALTYSLDLFDEGTANRMLGHLEMLLAAATNSPSSPISSLPLLTATERNQLLKEWNRTERSWELSRPIHAWFEEQAESTPESIAISCEKTQLRYADLNARANRLAKRLVALGVRPERTVGLCMERSVEMIIGLLAILKAGGAYVPLDPKYPKERLAFMIEDSKAALVLTQGSLLSSMPSTTAQVLCIDSEPQQVDEEDTRNLPHVSGPEHLAYVIYTSGSTGKPKGVMVEQRNLLSYVLGAMERLEIEPGWSYAMVQPLTVDSSVTMIYLALCSGGHLHVITNDRASDSYDLASYFQENRIDCLKIAPSHLAALHNHPQREWLMPRKRLVIGGESSHWDWVLGLQRLAPGCRVFNHYGPTETTVGVLVFPVDNSASERPFLMTPLGSPLPGTKIYILDEQLCPVPVGVTGQLYVGGSYVARGYLNLPELTSERFIADPFSSAPSARLYRTGDIARYLPEGDVEFLGRSDDQVKIRGFRIELREIEAAIVRHSNIRETVVLVREDTAGNKRLVAYLAAHTPPAPSTAELRTFLSEHLPGHMVPSIYVALPELPRTPHGKIDRRALPAPVRLQSEQLETDQLPRNRTEEILTRIWTQVLRLEHVGIHDNFFELGGDSILSIQIISRCNQAGLCFTAKQLFEHQTIAKLAPVVGSTLSVHAEQGFVSGVVPLTPIQERFFEQDPSEPHHFNQAFLLEIRRMLNLSCLREAIAALVMHHDVLRMQFRKEGKVWSQTHAESCDPEILTIVDLSGLNPAEQRRSMRDFAFQTQKSLDLGQKPLARFVFFDCGKTKRPRLLIVIHHLVVDGVSWRIILDDLENACDQRARGETIQLPSKTTSFQHWANRLRAYSESADVQRQLAYWLAEPSPGARAIPRDFSSAPDVNTVQSTRVVSTTLTVNQTRALLQDVPRTYRTQINDVLLTAILQGFAQWTGSGTLPITLESHGREAIFDDCDISRTVGWFTLFFPVTLDLGDASDIGSALRSVKEQLRRVPGHGMGYGVLRYLTPDAEIRRRLQDRRAPEVSFHYIGQADLSVSEGALFVPATEGSGVRRSGQLRRHDLIEILAKVVAGRFRLDCVYSTNFHKRFTIERLARNILRSLRAIIQHCQSSEKGWYTSSDFPLAKLDQDLFHRLFGEDRNIRQIYPLSPLQQGMLFHSLYTPDSDVYIGQRFRTLKNVDVRTFQRAWRRVLTRHPALRTAFAWKDLDEPLQIVRRDVNIHWEELDWQHLPSNEQASAFDQYLADDRKRGFELARPPLMRLALIQLGASMYRFVWSNHQLLLDGWSTTLILREVAAFYEAFRGGRNLHLRRPQPYQQFIAWLQTRDISAAETFWRKQLAGFSAPTRLSIDQPRHESGTTQEQYHGQRVQMSSATTEKLQDLTKDCHVTLNTVIQAAWALLLSRYSGERDVVFGAIVSGRPPELKGVEAMIGVFINTLPVRVRLNPDVSLRVWLKELQTQQVEARAFEYASLVQIQGCSEVPRGSRLFESILIFENHPTAASTHRSQGMEIRRIRPTERTNYPINVIATPGKELFIKILYDSTLFGAATIRRMLRHLQAILRGMASDGNRTVGCLPMLTAPERRQITDEWNKTSRSWPLDRPIHVWFEDIVRKTPNGIAISCRTDNLTFSNLNTRANRLARYLQKLGVREEHLVAICLERSVDAVVAMLAVLKTGAAYVPLDPAYPAKRLAFMIEDSKTVALITRESLRSLLPAASTPVVLIDSDSIAINRCSSENPPPTSGGQKPAYVIYTSGSTGRPKGVLGTHAGAVNRFLWMWESYPFGAGEVCCQKTALSFVDSIWEVFGPLLKGIRSIIIPDEALMDPHVLIRSLEEHRVTRIVLVPSLLRAILDTDFDLSRRLAALRICVSSGEALSYELVRRFRSTLPGAMLLNLYGSSEVSADATFYDTRACSQYSGKVPIGRPIANMRTYILDQSLSPVPVGIPGELYVAGVGVASGYLQRPELTREKFRQNPFSRRPGEMLFRTGDLARYLESGDIEYLGRRDNQVKIRGFRVELDEIEAVIVQHSAVQAAVVVDRENRSGDRQLVGYVVPKAGTRVRIIELRDFLRKRLPDYMVPRALIPIDQLPLTPNGKIDRRALPARDGWNHNAAATYVAPRTSVEATISALWTQIFGLEKVGLDDNFFDLGGHSLLAMQLVSRIRDAFHLELPLRTVFENSTVGALAEAISRSRERLELGEPEAIVPALRQQFALNLQNSGDISDAKDLDVPS